MKWLSRNYRGRFRHELDDIPIFHGGPKNVRPKKFKFSLARRESDFGKSAYFSFSHGLSDVWSHKRGGYVNSYIFHAGDARRDPDIQMIELDSPLEWLNMILQIYENGGVNPYDMIIGDIMDGNTGKIISDYQKLAENMGIPMSELPDDIKMEMIYKLNPKKIGLQIAFGNGESLRFVEFIDSVEASDHMVVFEPDPGDIAADISLMLVERFGISQNDALTQFMRSDTFRRIRLDESLCRLGPDAIMEMYLQEMNFRG